MKIKNISLLPLLASAVILLNTSCRFEEDEYFDQSASLRVTTTNEELKSLLVKQSSDANNGWVIQYFVGGTDEADFEGFNLFGRFYDNGKVLLASDHRYLRNGNANKYTEATSFYQITPEEGTLLSFPIWNDVLSVFADPVDPSSAPGSLVGDGVGMNGDYNLVLSSFKNDTIVFRGQRHQAEARFLKCDRSWQDYIAAVNDLKQKISNTYLTSYYVTTGDTVRYFSDLNTGVIAYTERVNNPLDKQTVTCVFTTKGFRLNHVTKLGENSFQEFTLDEANGKLYSEDGKTTVIPCWDNYVVDCPSDWRLDPDAFTTAQKELFEKMAVEVQKVNSQYVLDSIMIGRPVETIEDGSQQAFPALLVYIHGPKKMGRTPIYKPYIYMDITKPEFGVVTFSASSETKTSDFMKNFEGTDLKSLCEQFAATLYGTYQIKVNNYFHPVSAELTPSTTGNPVKLRMK